MVRQRAGRERELPEFGDFAGRGAAATSASSGLKSSASVSPTAVPGAGRRRGGPRQSPVPAGCPTDSRPGRAPPTSFSAPRFPHRPRPSPGGYSGSRWSAPGRRAGASAAPGGWQAQPAPGGVPVARAVPQPLRLVELARFSSVRRSRVSGRRRGFCSSACSRVASCASFSRANCSRSRHSASVAAGSANRQGTSSSDGKFSPQLPQPKLRPGTAGATARSGGRREGQRAWELTCGNYGIGNALKDRAVHTWPLPTVAVDRRMPAGHSTLDPIPTVKWG